jgi:hypothetical protein
LSNSAVLSGTAARLRLAAVRKVPKWHPERKHRKGCHSPETGAPHSRSGPHQGNHSPARLDAFSKLLCEKLDTADVQARKASLSAVIALEAGDGKIKVFTDKTALAAAAIAENASAPNIRGFVCGGGQGEIRTHDLSPSEAVYDLHRR